MEYTVVSLEFRKVHAKLKKGCKAKWTKTFRTEDIKKWQIDVIEHVPQFFVYVHYSFRSNFYQICEILLKMLRCGWDKFFCMQRKRKSSRPGHYVTWLILQSELFLSVYHNGQCSLRDTPAGSHGRCTDQHEHTLQDYEYNWHDSLQARLIERIVPIVPIKAISSPRRLQPEDTSSKHTLYRMNTSAPLMYHDLRDYPYPNIKATYPCSTRSGSSRNKPSLLAKLFSSITHFWMTVNIKQLNQTDVKYLLAIHESFFLGDIE